MIKRHNYLALYYFLGFYVASFVLFSPMLVASVAQVEQLHKIYKLCGSPSDEYWKRSKLPNATLFKPREPYKRRIRETFKDFPPSSLPLIDTLLAIDPADRQTATAALRSEVSSKVPFCFFLLLVHLEPIVFSSCSNISYLKWHKRTYHVHLEPIVFSSSS